MVACHNRAKLIFVTVHSDTNSIFCMTHWPPKMLSKIKSIQKNIMCPHTLLGWYIFSFYIWLLFGTVIFIVYVALALEPFQVYLNFDKIILYFANQKAQKALLQQKFALLYFKKWYFCWFKAMNRTTAYNVNPSDALIYDEEALCKIYVKNCDFHFILLV